MNKKIIISLITIVLLSVAYRVFPYRANGFVPQIALGIFAGFLFKGNKKWAFLVPLISMFLSDALYQVLYLNGVVSFKGFYGVWQIAQYACIAAVTFVGFYISQINTKQIGIASVVAPTLFFLFSNLFVWIEGAGYQHSYTLSGLYSCYVDGIPFYKASVIGTLVFSAIMFGIYYLQTNNSKEFAK